MNILGINGLGIAPSACIVTDGKLIAFAEEERFTRIKGSLGAMPGKASNFCLNFSGLCLNDIDYIALGWDAPRYRFYMPFFFASTYIKRAPKFNGSSTSNIYKVVEQLSKYLPDSINQMIAEMFRSSGIKGNIPPVKFIPHHIAHAASTFYTSGFEQAHILVIDGSGEDRCTSIMNGTGKDISLISSYKIPDSLGWFFQSMTEYLGFIPDRHEGKVMALASYGVKDNVVDTKIKKMFSYDRTGNYRYDAKYSFFGNHYNGRIYSEETVEMLGTPRYHNEPITDNHKNIAYSTQNLLEEIAQNIVSKISSFPEYNGNLCLAGGVALNCKMNGVIGGMDCVKNIFVPPVVNDAGTALGAALYLSNQKGYDPRFKMEHAYWGPEFSKEQIKQVLIKCGVRFKEESNIENIVAEILSQGKIVGWFQGRMEVGSRALGARSILASPILGKMKDIVNQRVKNRENWRPFAASVLYEMKDKYIINAKESPFMTLAFKVTDFASKEMPSATHIDNTTRPQLVKKEVTPLFWSVINEFGRITGIYAVLNTSFNMNEEPIVCTPEEALRAFYASGMDFLAISDYLVSK